jgi:hypothetical protein
VLPRSTRRGLVALIAVAAALAASVASAQAAPSPLRQNAMTSETSALAASDVPNATPRPHCRRGSHPETGMQGRVPAGTKAGFTCNLKEISHFGNAGGYKVRRYVDRAGHVCAFYDSTLLFPSNLALHPDKPAGVYVLDMSNPRKPVRTAALETPAMLTPHESLQLNTRRGLLTAVTGNPVAYPGGQVDVYSVRQDCRHPQLQSSLPVGVIGHESAFAPDGRTFYATSLFSGQVTAIDVTNPKLPHILGVYNYPSHGLSISADGKRGYVAGRKVGLIIIDLSEVQERKPNPKVHEISRLGWPTLTIPQIALPVTIGGHRFAVEIDEFSTSRRGGDFPAASGPYVGAARIIDIENEKAPRVVSNIRLQVNQPANRAKVAGDPGAGSMLQGYAGHYCAVPRSRNPGIVACSFIASGLRIFDIRDPYHPRELAYFTTPEGPSASGGEASNYAMSSPAFDARHGQIWYSDGNTGFYALKVAKGVWPFAHKPKPKPRKRPRRCRDRRKFTFHLHHNRGARVIKVAVYVNGKRRFVRRGHNIRRVTLKRLPRKHRFRVKIVTTQSNGAVSTSVRTYRGCHKSAPRTRGRHPGRRH